MGLTVASRSSWWRLHVLCLVILRPTWVISEESTPTSDTHWGNVTTGPDQVYITNEDTSGTLNITVVTNSSSIATGPDLVYNSSKEISGTPNTTLEVYSGNVTTGPDQVFITSEVTNGTPSTSQELNSINITTGPDLVYTTSKETSRTLNNTVVTDRSNVTTAPDLVYTINKETSGTLNNTVVTDRSNVTTAPDLVYTTNKETSGTLNNTVVTDRSNVTTAPDLVYTTNKETSRTLNNTVVTDRSNVTTAPDLVYTTNKETSRTLNNTVVTDRSNVTTAPDLVYTTNKETSGTPNNTEVTDRSNVTTAPDLVYTTNKETSGTATTTIETYWSNVTTAPDLVFTTNKETSGTATTTLETYSSHVTTDPEQVSITSDENPGTPQETYLSNVTTRPGSAYIFQDTSGTSSPIFADDSTTGPDLSYIIETSGTPNTTLDVYSNTASLGSHLTYVPEDAVRTPSPTTETFPDVTSSEALTPGTPDMTLQTDGASFFSAMYCLRDADCPPFTMCTELGGHHICQCHLGSYFHQDLGCVTARTFPARIPASVLYWDKISLNTSGYRNEIRHSEAAEHLQGIHRVALLFQNVLGHIPGYLSTSIIELQWDEGLATIVHSFSTLYAVTEDDLWGALTVSPLLCTHSSCVSPLTSDTYQGLTLCDFDICDSSSSDCHSHSGLVTCECRTGYYKLSPTDHTCRACGSGYQRTENGCERCPIGFGGFNCEESYLLVVIVESCVGCVLLVSLITLLVFYFRRKEPQKPTYIDNIVLRVPTDQPSIRLPRAQFSWRREWEWNEPAEKVLTDIQQEAAIPDGPVIHMKTFGDPARFSAPNTFHGRHNLSFISD
ncbi:protein HEG-like [Dendropsophus ebraccatus]|uniref:protein HEG-like n=1 Tax=Dendropsophus ebraccatus TaxID=150705 RepID=UPI00383120E1